MTSTQNVPRTGTHAVRPLREGLLPAARRHSSALQTGLAFTLVLVACRLALPLPLTAIVHEASAGSAAAANDGRVTWYAAAFVGLSLASGLVEYVVRLQFANFANRTIGDARHAATRVTGSDASGRAAQVVADSARVKQGLKGVLNHVVLNALLVLGAAVAVLLTAPRLGLVLCGGLVALLAVGAVGSRGVARVAEAHRGEEAQFAAAVHEFAASEPGPQRDSDVVRLHRLDEESGYADVGLTRGEGRCTWVAHGLLTGTFAVVLFLGMSDATAGRLTSADLFTVVGYLLVLHGPGVRLARQMCRMGAVLVTARHLGHAVCRAAADRSPTDR